MDLIVVEVHYQTRARERAFDADRIPLIHEPGHLYVGLPGGYHEALKKDFDLEGTGRGPNQCKGYQEVPTKDVGWYGARRPSPDELEAIHQTLGGQAAPPPPDWDDDHFWQGSWTASFLAAQGVNVVQCTAPDHEAVTNEYPYDPSRIPWKYDPVKGNVFVGHPGYYHMNVAASPEFDPEAGRRTQDGFIHTDGSTGWYGNPFVDDRYAVERAVGNHLGLTPFNPSQPGPALEDDLWD